MTKIVFIGGGGFAKEVLEIAELNRHDVIGYVGDSEGVLPVPYWGGTTALLERRKEFDAVCVAFGAIDRKSVKMRSAMIEWLSEQGFASLPLVSPYSVRSKGVSIAGGAIVAHNVVMSVDASIGAFAILNTSAIVGHDAQVGRNVTMAPGSFLGGHSHIGDDSLIGPGAIVLEGRKIGSAAIVGFGATVPRDVKDGDTIAPLRSKVLK